MFRIASRLIQARMSQGRSRPGVSLGVFVIVVCSAIPASAQVIVSINPNSAVAGGPAFSLSITGSGFNGPPWSVRVSLANLQDADYVQIGKNLAEICHNAAAQWRKSQPTNGASRRSRSVARASR